MTDITTPQQHPVPYVQRVAQIICTGLYPEADAAGKRLADFPKATRENLLTIAEAILLETTTEAQSAQRYAWWVTPRDELDGLAPAQLIIGGPLDTADGALLHVDAHQRRHFLKPWRERLGMLLQLLTLPGCEVGGLGVLASQRAFRASELKVAMGFASPSQVQGGWLWMTHPDRNNGEPVPVQLVRDEDDGSLWYVPFDEAACEFEWSERDPDWQVVPPVQPVAWAYNAAAPRAALEPNRQPNGGYPGCDACACKPGTCHINAMLRAPSASAQQVEQLELARAVVQAWRDADSPLSLALAMDEAIPALDASLARASAPAASIAAPAPSAPPAALTEERAALQAAYDVLTKQGWRVGDTFNPEAIALTKVAAILAAPPALSADQAKMAAHLRAAHSATTAAPAAGEGEK